MRRIGLEEMNKRSCRSWMVVKKGAEDREKGIGARRERNGVDESVGG